MNYRGKRNCRPIVMAGLAIFDRNSFCFLSITGQSVADCNVVKPFHSKRGR